MVKTFIFDYDDTLAANQHDYSRALLKFLNWMIFDKLGYYLPDVQSIVNTEVEIDLKNLKTMGFSRKRFPTSLRDTYRHFCEQAGIKPNKKDLNEAYRIGALAFDEEEYKKRGLLPGAEETLDYLIKQKDELMILTKGDSVVQKMKVRATNMKRWFRNRINIVTTKDANTLTELAGKRDKKYVYHVGNSIRSDVNLALEAGIKAIYIPCETWKYEREHNGLPDNPNLIKFNNIIKIKQKYNSF